MRTISRKQTSTNDTAALQIILNKFGNFGLVVDGDFGNNTEKCLQTAQQRLGISPDGICGTSTRNALIKAIGVNKLGVTNFDYRPMWYNKSIHGKLRPYFLEEQPKKHIFLHHAAGNSDPYSLGDWFQKYDGVATCFGIGGYGEHDGMLIQLFEDVSQWGFHVNMLDDIMPYGRNGTTANFQAEHQLAKQSLAVEVCNWGALEYKNGKFQTLYPTPTIIPEYQVQTYAKPFRGYTHFHKYTPAQIQTLKEMILGAEKLFKIKCERGIYNQNWFDLSYEAIRLQRVLISHINVRINKSDMHPQPELIQMLNSL